MSRGESCVVILLQRATDAKRSYGTILSAIGVFGETNDLFYHYSENLYKEVLLKAYKEADVDPSKVAFVECEGLGILVNPYHFYSSIIFLQSVDSFMTFLHFRK